ncbi:probable peptidyl-tRNA hydrolase 2 [Patiria miniata]|uniref:peptidyl-tRNA hydrolase n=1 Tax=Patiria miniata TaxID=46514 RepID=A0A914BAV0_PATMI|nr:probable peptidyl-tRNA hydrolase 2 [Patiria miniata]XP_038073195.1 probable peptidyl-tRNA hydrolase 2 [Patiria miniata]XP_038073196.1 probable peptidyl-tRNA hydrolase 2 [Patiria miniata]
MSDSDRPPPVEARLPGLRPEPEGGPAVNPEHLRALSEMGIPEAMAEKALLLTGGQSLEAAAAWYFDGGDENVSVTTDSYMDDGSEEQMLQAVQRVGADLFMTGQPMYETRPGEQNLVPCSGTLGGSDRIKMVFVVNEELKMGKGKIAAQVAHSCLGLYRTLLQDRARHEHCLVRWETQGETKIVLCGSNAEHLLDLQKRASFASLPSHLTQDAGRTQVPAESFTVLSIFGEAKQVDQITGALSLL